MGKSAFALLLTTLGPLWASGFVSNTVPHLLRQHAIFSRHVRLSSLKRGVSAVEVESDLPTSVADRRSFLTTSTTAAVALLTTSILPQPSNAAKGKVVNGKVVVFGGSGYVGSYVDQQLSSLGYKVVSVARASPSDQADKVSKNVGTKPANVEYVSLDAGTDDLTAVLKDASVVVSCIGALGSGAAIRSTNGATNARIAAAARSAGATRFVYVSVASELANGPARFLLGDYLKGKAEAESAVTKAFGGADSLLVKPAILEGAPPGEIRPPGPPGVKAAAVKDVARAVVAGVTGEKSGSIDGNAAISAL